MTKQRQASLLLCLPRWDGPNHGMFLGMCDLKTFLQHQGIRVEIFDADVAHYAANQEDIKYEQILEDALCDFQPDFVGIHINTPNYKNALELVETIHRLHPEAKVIVGGPHASVAWQCLLLMHKEIDFVIVGEGEKPLLELIKQNNNVKQGSLPPGVAGRVNNDIKYIPATYLPSESLMASDRRALLDSPFELLRKWAPKRYLDNFYGAISSFSGRRATNIYIARGCTKKCPYCSPGAFWKDPISGLPKQRLKPVSELEKELCYLKSFGFSAVYFDEMAMPFQAENTMLELATILYKYDFFWGGAVLFNQIKHIDLERLAALGLRYLYFGLETPQPHLQKIIEKKSSDHQVITFIEKCFSLGIQCDLSMFFGIPGETEKTVRDTVAWLNKYLPRGNAFFSIAAIWPGTQWAQQFGLGAECWEPSFDKKNAPGNVVWYSHDMTSIGKFFSNSLGTYHPPFLTPQKALWIKQLIIDSGFRERFAKFSRKA